MNRRSILMLALVLSSPVLAVGQEGAIPPQVAERLGIPPEKVRQVRELAFAANDEVISLEADVRKAQLALDREIHSTAPDEKKIGPLVDAVSRAEAGVRKNRIGLALKVRKALGEEAWQKLEAWRMENAPARGPGGRGFGPGGGMGPQGGPQGQPRQGEGMGGPPMGRPMGPGQGGGF